MTVSEQIIQVIDALCAKFGLAIDWTSENVIPYLTTLCGKLVLYEIWTSVFWIVFMTALTISSIIATKKFAPIFKNGVEEDRENYDCGWQIGTVLAIIGLIALYIATICVIGTQITDIIKCTTFPEMYIFEYVQSIINSGS
jgi:xanthosine utilization system XapX-like protein